jgi:hypothetical protein
MVVVGVVPALFLVPLLETKVCPQPLHRQRQEWDGVAE